MVKSKKKTENRLKGYYYNLSPENANGFRIKVMEYLKISKATFYVRLNQTHLYSPSDKESIAKFANVPPYFLFPELEPQNH